MWVKRQWRARGVPTPSQFVRCGKDALLQVVEQMTASSSLAGSVIAACTGSLSTML
jgi:hypothetical protein